MRKSKYSTTTILQSSVILAVLVTLSGGARANDETLALVSKIEVGGNGLGAFDISFVDPKIDLYVLADRTNASVDLVDASDNSFIGRVGGFTGNVLDPNTGLAVSALSGPDGVVIVDHKEIWAGDGDSTIKVIDIASMQVVKTISTGDPTKDKRVDEMAYDSRDHILAAANNAAQPPFVTLFDTRAHEIIGKIVFDGSNNTPDATLTGIEQPQWSPKTGLFYVSVPQIVPGTDNAAKAKGGVTVIDPSSMMVTQTFEVDNCSPTGFTLGPNNQAVVGCGGAFGTAPNVTVRTPVIDITTGMEVKSFPLGGEDQVWYDPATHHYYVPARSNVDSANTPNPVLFAIDGLTLDLDATVPISTTSHSVAADPHSHHIFIPTGFVPPSSKPGTDPSNPCPTSGCIAVYLPSALDSDDETKKAVR